MKKQVVDETGLVILGGDDPINILKKTVCIDHTDEQVKFFMRYCEAKRLDPFAREVHSIIRKGKQTFQMGIDGLRTIAEDTGEYAGSESYWCGEDGKWVDIWVSKTPPFAAKVIQWRKGSDHPFIGIAIYSEYKPDEDWMWRKMPSNQLAKCAEALALRKAFPRRIGGIYSNEEMAQDDRPDSWQTIKQPTEKKLPPRALLDNELAITPKSVKAQPTIEYESSENVLDGMETPMHKDEPPIEWPDPIGKKAIEEPKETGSKFLGRLHQVAREKGLSPEKMKTSIEILFKKKSSKELTDPECSSLIKQIELGAIRNG